MNPELEAKLVYHTEARLGSDKKPLNITPEMVEFWESFGISPCRNYRCAVDQRESEIKQGWGKKGTHGFEAAGCYSGCRGYDPLCKARYVQDSEAEKIISYCRVVGEMEE